MCPNHSQAHEPLFAPHAAHGGGREIVQGPRSPPASPHRRKGVGYERVPKNGNLISGIGKLPFNTDGGGLCNNHPANRGSMTKGLEAVRQLRGEAHPAVQVKNCDLALAQGTGFQLATRHGSATMIMERE
jgi:acetyl-CoA C-acetyltransferase